MNAAGRSTLVWLGFALLAAGANAYSAEAAADATLVNRIRDAVIQELRDSGALDRAVDAGVSRFVDRQRAEEARREQREAEAQVAKLRPVSLSRDHIRGNAAAQVTLVEYSDFECPFCKRFHSTAKRLVDQSNGRVRWVYRHFPLDELHTKARKEAAASECAAELGGNDAFWKFTDRFFELTPSNDRTDIDTVLPQIAGELGLDKVRFAACIASGKHEPRIAEDHQNATATGGRGTPWSIVVSRSGKTYPLSGAQPYAVVKQLTDLALER